MSDKFYHGEIIDPHRTLQRYCEELCELQDDVQALRDIVETMQQELAELTAAKVAADN